MEPKKQTLIILFTLAILSGFFWNHKMFGAGIADDQASYDAVAWNHEDVPVEPVYPFFLSAVYGVFGHSYDAVRVVQVILFALVVVLAARMFGFWVGLVTSLFYGLASTAGVLSPTLLTTLLTLLLTWLLMTWRRGVPWKHTITLGIIPGILALTVGIFQGLIIVPIILVVRSGWKTIVLVLVGFMIVMGPWFIHQGVKAESGTVVPRGGMLLLTKMEFAAIYSRNYPGHLVGHLVGYFFAQQLYPGINVQTAEMDAVEKRLYQELAVQPSYAEADKQFMREALQRIVHKPQQFLFISLLNVINLNSPIIPRTDTWQNQGYVHPMFTDRSHPTLPFWVKACIVALIHLVWFAFLYFVLRGTRNAPWAIIFIVLYFNLAYGLIHGLPRYTLPIYPLYIFLAIRGIVTRHGRADQEL